MKLRQQILKTLKKHPHWSARRVAEELGVSANTISVTASRAKIKFMTRREAEDYLDGKKK